MAGGMGWLMGVWVRGCGRGKIWGRIFVFFVHIMAIFLFFCSSMTRKVVTKNAYFLFCPNFVNVLS